MQTASRQQNHTTMILFTDITWRLVWLDHGAHAITLRWASVGSNPHPHCHTAALQENRTPFELVPVFLAGHRPGWRSRMEVAGSPSVCTFSLNRCCTLLFPEVEAIHTLPAISMHVLFPTTSPASEVRTLHPLLL